MKKILSLLFPLAAVISGCNLEETQNPQMDLQDERTFTASFEQNETRTYVENGNLLRWDAGDQISIFDGNTLNRQYQFDGETGDNAGTFSIVNKPFGTGNDLNCHYAVYPYSSGIKITESGVISATLPAEQNYAKDSFGIGANTMVAVTKDVDDTFLKFKNVGGYLKLQLYGEDITVKSITLNGNNNEKLAGKATITPAHTEEPTVEMGDEATASITLDCYEGVRIGSTEETATAFWIVVPPTTFTSGFSITITDVNGETFTKETSNEITIERNVIKPMKAFEVVIENETEEEGSPIPNNQIWYTATAKIESYWDNVFGANIVSNTWDSESGKGVITFDSDVTKIGTEAFYQCSDLTSVTLPDEVTTIEEKAFASCNYLKSVNIPDRVTIIGASAFYNCSGLTSVTFPDKVTTIGDNAFVGCNSLTSVTLPDSVTQLGNLAFQACLNIKEFKGKFAADNGRCLIIDNTIVAYANASGDVYSIPDGITRIPGKVFYMCDLTSITIPDSVTEIERYAFYMCQSLENITLGSGITTIGEFAFNSCHNIKEFKGKFAADNGRCLIIDNTIVAYAEGSGNEYIIPNNVTSIGDNAFYYCTKLESVTIPESVTKIGTSAFSSCSKLKYVYCEPTTPPSIGLYGGEFSNNASGRKFYVPQGSVDTYKSADGWSNYASYIVGYDL